MILMDLFGEDMSTNVRVLYVPNSDRIDDIMSHIGPESMNFTDIDICFISVGHHDLHTRLGQFIQDFKRLIKALHIHNVSLHYVCLAYWGKSRAS